VLLLDAAGERDVNGIVLEVGGAQVAQQLAAVGVRVGRQAAVAGRGQLLQLGDQRAVFVKQLFGVVAAQPLFQLAMCASWLGMPTVRSMGTWCARKVPSICLPSTSFGPVQPFGVRSTIIGQRMTSGRLPLRQADWMLWI